MASSNFITALRTLQTGEFYADLRQRPRYYARLCSYYLVHLLAFLIPLNRRWVPLCIALLLITSAFESSPVQKWRNLMKRKQYFFLFISLYLVHVAGMFYSTNWDYGLFDLEVKYSIFIFPIILLTTGFLNRFRTEKVLSTFVMGCLVGVLVSFFRAVYYYYRTGELQHFYYHEFTFEHHPSYFSMYINLSLCILIKFIFDQKNRFRLRYFIMMTIFILANFQLASRNGILCMIAILTFTFFYLILPRIKWKKSLLGLIITLGISTLVLYNSNYSINRFASAAEELTSNNPVLKQNSAGIRAEIWKLGYSRFQQDPIAGVGTGDVGDEFIKKYREVGLTKALIKNLNAHNQYMQTSVALGVIGLLILLLNLAYPFIQSFRKNHLIYGFFIFVFGFSLLTESMLETQAGVVFFAMFQSLLVLAFPNPSQNTPGIPS